ncbi:hypothetical protein MMC07_002506 [Pseudocyphellaria aurata]|nr:hypothetical protein [Pseudocyphellaria aurata]
MDLRNDESFIPSLSVQTVFARAGSQPSEHQRQGNLPIDEESALSSLPDHPILPDKTGPMERVTEQPATQTSGLNGAEAVGTKSGPPRPYRCPLCLEARYTRRYTLKQHFPKCVEKRGNPHHLKWDDDPSVALYHPSTHHNASGALVKSSLRKTGPKKESRKENIVGSRKDKDGNSAQARRVATGIGAPSFIAGEVESIERFDQERLVDEDADGVPTRYSQQLDYPNQEAYERALKMQLGHILEWVAIHDQEESDRANYAPGARGQ